MGKEEAITVIKQYAQKIVRDFGPEKIILFGSFAWGEPGRDSDADLLVVKETDDTRALRREIDGALFPRELAVDLLVYQPKQLEQRVAKGDSFLTKVLREGTVLYAR